MHALVPGAGLDSHGQVVRVKNPKFLTPLGPLRNAFRHHMRQLLSQKQGEIDPVVWTLKWGVHIQPVGSGQSAIKYLGNYVARTAISDARIQAVTHEKVFFRWKDRADHNRSKSLQLPGVQFLERYFHHVLPTGLRSVRYYGFCHPAAKAARLRIQLGLGAAVDLGASDFTPSSQPPTQSAPSCPFCNGPTLLVAIMKRNLGSRGPPYTIIPVTQPSAACA